MTMTSLAEFLPTWDFRETHQADVPGDSAEVLRAVEQVRWRDVPLFRTISSITSLGRAQPNPDAEFLTQMTSGGFTVLDRRDDELVIGAIAPVAGKGRSIELSDDPAAQFTAFAQPGYYKVAFNFRHTDTTLSTETRVQVTDAASRPRFALYWALIRVPSGLIRREWLRATRRAMQTRSTPAGQAG